jgi:hypothetical protein
MSQTLRPDSNVTQTNVVGGFADIDETIASDADFVASNSSSIGTLVVGLSSPSGTPGTGTSTIRYRAAKVGTGSLTATIALLENTTVLDTAPAQSLTTTYTTYTWNPDTSGVSNWANVRFRCRFSADASATGRLSWMEFQVPSPALSLVCSSRALVLTGTSVTLNAPRSLAIGAGSFAFTGAAVTFVKAGRNIVADAGSFALTGAALSLRAAYKFVPAAGSFALSGSAASLGKGIAFIPAAGAFSLVGADLAMSLTERDYFFEGHPKPFGSHQRRLSVRSNHRWR